MAKHVNTFAQGIDKDSSKNKYDNVHYYHAQNFRIVTQDEMSSGALENIKGAASRILLLEDGNHSDIVGMYTLGDTLIIWSKQFILEGIDYIWGIPVADIKAAEVADTQIVLTTATDYVHNGGYLIYKGDLDLNTSNRIHAIGRVENDNLKKVYWADGINRLRHLNIIYNADTNDLETLTPDQLEVIGDIDLSTPKITGITGGNLKSGKIGYTYQLYKIGGAETVFSSVSGLVPLTNSSDYAASSENYRGADIDVATGKAVQGEITIDQAGYQRIRIISIHYTDYNLDPEIRIIEERDIGGVIGETVEFTDTGITLGNLILEDVRTVGTNLFIPGVIETKDNILFAGNIIEETFDVDFDARAYRYAGISNSSLDYNYNQYSTRRAASRITEEDGSTLTIYSHLMDPARTIDAAYDVIYPTSGEYMYAGVEYKILTRSTIDFTLYGASSNLPGHTFECDTTIQIGAGDSLQALEPVWLEFTGSGGPLDTIPETQDAINTFNDLDNDGDHLHRFMYQADGETLGGEGSNIKYEFRVKTIKLDSFVAGSEEKISAPQGTGGNFSYTNYASPYNVAEYVGYMRDETYRFGIVFFDDKGRSSFVKWIADIRFPSISSLTKNITYATTDAGEIFQQDTVTIDDFAESSFRISFAGESFNVYNSLISGSWVRDAEDIASLLTDEINTNSSYATATYVGNIITITFTEPGNYEITVDTDTMSTLNVATYSTPGTTYYDFSPAYLDNSVAGDKVLYANILYPYFTVSNLPSNIVNYQIVRVQRVTNDRSVVTQGIAMGTLSSGADRYHPSWAIGAGWSDTYTFQSPEVAIFKNITLQSNDKLQNVCTLEDPTGATYGSGALAFPKITSEQPVIYKYGPLVALASEQKPISTSTGDEVHAANNQTTMEEAAIVRQDEITTSLGSILYLIDNATDSTEKGISMVFNAANTSWNSKNKGTGSRYITNYRRNVHNTRYGGITYTARRRNIYNGASDVQNANAPIVTCYGGDTYINMFDYLYRSYQDAAVRVTPTSKAQVIYFPVESTINLDLRNDLSTRHVYGQSNADLIHDSAGIWTNSLGDEFTQSDLYVYNTVYSKENDTKLFISKPFDYQAQKTFNARVFSSDVKVQNELSDSWLKFRANAYRDVDPQYGEITGLINVSERLMFFQPRAFGILSVNERALIQTQDTSQLSLGTSGVLERFDYAKTGIGAVSREHIYLSPNGLYWVDEINKAMMKFSSGIEEVSMMKGLDGWFRTNIVRGNDMLMWYNPEYREVCLTDRTDSWTILYSEVTDGFISFITSYPDLAVNYENRVLTTTDKYNVFLHDDLHADRASFHSGVQDSTITLVINPSQHDIAIYNNMEWLTEALSSAGVDIQETFDKIEIWNDYQHTGVVNLVVDQNIKRRMRMWRHIIPRARYKKDGVTVLDRRDARLRDSHIFVKLYLTNADNKKFIVHDIITSHTISNK